jgi:hypothetical protein
MEGPELPGHEARIRQLTGAEGDVEVFPHQVEASVRHLDFEGDGRVSVLKVDERTTIRISSVWKVDAKDATRRPVGLG